MHIKSEQNTKIVFKVLSNLIFNYVLISNNFTKLQLVGCKYSNNQNAETLLIQWQFTGRSYKILGLTLPLYLYLFYNIISYHWIRWKSISNHPLSTNFKTQTENHFANHEKKSSFTRPWSAHMFLCIFKIKNQLIFYFLKLHIQVWHSY